MFYVLRKANSDKAKVVERENFFFCLVLFNEMRTCAPSNFHVYATYRVLNALIGCKTNVIIKGPPLSTYTSHRNKIWYTVSKTLPF